jgi:hypothetical protein
MTGNIEGSKNREGRSQGNENLTPPLFDRREIFVEVGEK